eukprot:NODE_409_length_2287_cov_35.605898_g376_i0.p1 GENE.NODE_409_length_2287_cov_35.605898_g376_i0~~NODE_409_length_2287_cov_35.605898_g376_i0.p1  ORF type:complete len:537 (-),score=47.54 NODE_409_length_2287_cov_35.605898_g376_i0:539-2149(-)
MNSGGAAEAEGRPAASQQRLVIRLLLCCAVSGWMTAFCLVWLQVGVAPTTSGGARLPAPGAQPHGVVPRIGGRRAVENPSTGATGSNDDGETDVGIKDIVGHVSSSTSRSKAVRPRPVTRVAMARRQKMQSEGGPRIPNFGELMLPRTNIVETSLPSLDVQAMGENNGSFEALGCSNASTRCPELTQCALSRYVCRHDWAGRAALEAKFPWRDAYQHAFHDVHMVVLPNMLLHSNGHLVSLHGARQTAYWAGMCPWGTSNAARSEIIGSVLHYQRAVTLLHPYAVNFYHFIAETLPKYYFAAPMLRALPSIEILVSHHWKSLVEILFPNETFASRTQHLKGWGHGKPKNEKGIFKYVFANHLFVPIAPRCGFPPMGALAEMRNDYLHIVRDVAIGVPPAADLIIVYNRNNFTSRRSVRQHPALFSALQREHGRENVVEFLGVWPRSPREDLKLLARGKVLLGPHGAGLAAMVFLPKDAGVIELRPKVRTEPRSCFEFMAWAAGLRFRVIRTNGNNASPMAISITEVTKSVRDLTQE